MSRVPLHDENDVDDEPPFLGEENDYAEFRFDGEDDSGFDDGDFPEDDEFYDV